MDSILGAPLTIEEAADLMEVSPAKKTSSAGDMIASWHETKEGLIVLVQAAAGTFFRFSTPLAVA